MGRVSLTTPTAQEAPQQGATVQAKISKAWFERPTAGGAWRLVVELAFTGPATIDSMAILLGWVHQDGSQPGYNQAWVNPTGVATATMRVAVVTNYQFSDPASTKFLAQALVRNIVVGGQPLPDAINTPQVPVSIPSSGVGGDGQPGSYPPPRLWKGPIWTWLRDLLGI